MCVCLLCQLGESSISICPLLPWLSVQGSPAGGRGVEDAIKGAGVAMRVRERERERREDAGVQKGGTVAESHIVP